MSVCTTVGSVLKRSTRCIRRCRADLRNFSTILLPNKFACNSCLHANTVTHFTGVVDRIIHFTRRNGPMFNAYGKFRVLTRTNLLPNTLHHGSALGFIYGPRSLGIIGTSARFASLCGRSRVVSIPVTRNRKGCFYSTRALTSLGTGGRVMFACTGNGPGNDVRSVTNVVGGGNGILNVVPRPRHTIRTLLKSTSNLHLFRSVIRGCGGRLGGW